MDNIFLKQAEIGEKTEKELCELLDQVDTEAMLSAMAAQLLLRSVEEMAGDKYGNHSALLEVIAFYAIPRLKEILGDDCSNSIQTTSVLKMINL